MSDSRPYRVLLVEDDPAFARLVGALLTAAGEDSCSLHHVSRLTDALPALEAGGIDVALLDLDLPDSQGLVTFLRVHTFAPRLPVVVLCEQENVQTARWAVQAGAVDHLDKRGATQETLAWALRYAVDHARWLACQETVRAEAEAARRRADLLARTSDVLAQSLDYPATLRQVADLVVGSIASYCVIDLLAEDGSLQRVVATGPDSAHTPLLRQLELSPPRLDTPHPVWHVIRTGEALLLPDVPPALLATFAADVEYVTLLRQLDVQALLVAPLQARGRMLGTIELLWSTSQPLLAAGPLAGSSTGHADVLLLVRALADRAAVAIDNARLHSELQSVLKARESFFAAVSHDLRNPLGTIGLWTEQLQRIRPRLTHPEDARMFAHAIGRIERAVTRSTRLIEEVLDVARLDAGQPLPLERDDVDLVALTREAVHEQVAMTDRAVDLELRVAELSGLWDGPRLARVVHNLMANALKYSPDEHPVTVRISHEAAPENGWAVLSVQDRGIGIPAADLPNIFQRFYRASNARGHTGGTGLGLWGARHIVEQHGGTLTLQSHEGVGTTATVRLPLSESEEEPVADEAPAN